MANDVDDGEMFINTADGNSELTKSDHDHAK